MPKYKLIGRNFRFGQGLDYCGPIIASDDAFFLFIDRTPTEAYGGVIGGALGALIGSAIDGGPNKLRDVMQFDYSALPAEITSHEDWPLRERSKGPVIVVPSSAIDEIRNAYFGTYDLCCGERTYGINLKIIGRSSVMQFLTSSGWDSKVNHSGAPSVAIQMAPLIGIGVGGVVGAIVGFAMKAPMVGVFSTPMLIGGGVLLGFIIGAIVSANTGKK